MAVVTATGMDTEIGKIADALVQTEEGKTPLQIKLGQLSKILTWLVLGICAIVFLVQLLKAGGIGFEVVLDSFVAAASVCGIDKVNSEKKKKGGEHERDYEDSGKNL